MRLCHYRDTSKEEPTCKLGLPMRCYSCPSFRMGTVNLNPPSSPVLSRSPSVPSPTKFNECPKEKAVLKLGPVSGGCGCKRKNAPKT